EGIPTLHRQIARAAIGKQLLQREHLLDTGEITGDGADALAIDAGHPRRNRSKGFVPGRSTEPAALTDIGPIEPLGAQAVDDVTRLVGNPFLVDGLVD